LEELVQKFNETKAQALNGATIEVGDIIEQRLTEIQHKISLSIKKEDVTK
jgi:hypothetical protein